MTPFSLSRFLAFALLPLAPAAHAGDPDATRHDWPMFRGNPQLTGVAESALPDELEVLWRAEFSEAILSSAAIVDDAVYVGCDDGNLHAFDLADGKVRFRYLTGSTIESSPLVLDGVIYFGDNDGVFHAVDARSGKAKWTFKTGGQIISSANHDRGRVLFGSYDGILYCLSAADGAVVWKYTTADRLHGTPGLAEKFVLIAGCDENLHVVDVETGQKARDVSMSAVCGTSAAIRGPHVYLGTYGNQVLDINWKEGSLAWKFEDTDRQFPYMSSASITDELVILGGRDKRIRALRRDTGEQAWEFPTQSRIDSSPVVCGSRVFVGSSDGNLYALNVRSGEQVWRFETGAAITASPAIGRERLVIGTTDGILYCFGSKTEPPQTEPSLTRDNP